MPPEPAARVEVVSDGRDALVGMGSNVGDRLAACTEALDRLQKTEGVRIIRVSSFYETEPVGYQDQGLFVNAAVRLQTTRTPFGLLDALLAVEKGMGRERTFKWGPRLIDLDLLLMEDIVINDPRLTLPHPFMHERAFVLVPLAEIAPHAVHPVLGRSVQALLDALPDAARGIRKI